MRRKLLGVTLSFSLFTGLAACGDVDSQVGTSARSLEAADYIITSVSGLPDGFRAIVADLGDTLVRYYPKAGFAVVNTPDPDRYKKYGSVLKDLKAVWVDPGLTESFAEPEAAGGVNDPYLTYQWGHDAVGAKGAWAAGVKGAGVKVAVLDTGFDTDHPDLVANIDFANSANFVPYETLTYALPNAFSHGTHTAGTVAANDNSWGTVGVAPDAQLILVKVLDDAGSGSFSWIMAGIVHAADAGADIITMSLGAYLPASTATFMNHVVNYAKQKGALILAAAGNDAYDLDHLWDYRHIPSGCQGVLAVSATAPQGWAWGATYLDNLSSYSNYGQGQVDFAAPGGDFVYYPYSGYHYDMVLSTGNGGWYWSAGTSMASPHAAGVAALILSEDPTMGPAQLEAVMRKRAADLGKPGNDDAYGMGRVSSGY